MIHSVASSHRLACVTLAASMLLAGCATESATPFCSEDAAIRLSDDYFLTYNVTVYGGKDKKGTCTFLRGGGKRVRISYMFEDESGTLEGYFFRVNGILYFNQIQKSTYRLLRFDFNFYKAVVSAEISYLFFGDVANAIEQGRIRIRKANTEGRSSLFMGSQQDWRQAIAFFQGQPAGFERCWQKYASLFADRPITVAAPVHRIQARKATAERAFVGTFPTPPRLGGAFVAAILAGVFIFILGIHVLFFLITSLFAWDLRYGFRVAIRSFPCCLLLQPLFILAAYCSDRLHMRASSDNLSVLATVHLVLTHLISFAFAFWLVKRAQPGKQPGGCSTSAESAADESPRADPEGKDGMREQSATCPFCGRTGISPHAPICPGCGHPLKAHPQGSQ